MTKLNKGVLKVLARAYWNDAVNGNPKSDISLKRAIDLNYVKPVQVPRSERKIKLLRELGGYSEEFINKTKTVYWLTEKGLGLFKATNNYKKSNPKLNS